MSIAKFIDSYIYAFTVPHKKWYIDEVETKENIISKGESESRLFKLSAAISLILLFASSLLTLTIEIAEKEKVFSFFTPTSLNQEKIALDTMKIINTYHAYSQRIALAKNLSLLVLEEENHEYSPSVSFFFTETHKKFYKISPDVNKNVKIFDKFYQERILPKTFLPDTIEYYFDHRSTGVRVGQFFWIFGGALNCQGFPLGNTCALCYFIR